MSAPEWDSSIPIISLWQPWASWVMLGWKTIETRTHRRFAGLVGKWVGIHASVKWDDAAIEAAAPYLYPPHFAKIPDLRRSRGAILGKVAVVGFRELTEEDAPQALVECQSVKRYGLFLAYPKTCEAIPAKGKQGIWYYRGRSDEPQSSRVRTRIDQ